MCVPAMEEMVPEASRSQKIQREGCAHYRGQLRPGRRY